MKKIATLTIGILLSGVLLAQVPYEVDKTLKVVDGVEKEVTSTLTNITFKILSDLDHLKIVFENEDFDIKVKPKKLDIVKYERTEGGIGGLTIYTCNSEEMGDVIIESELLTMTGKIKFDRDRDGVYEETLILN